MGMFSHLPWVDPGEAVYLKQVERGLGKWVHSKPTPCSRHLGSPTSLQVLLGYCEYWESCWGSQGDENSRLGDLLMTETEVNRLTPPTLRQQLPQVGITLKTSGLTSPSLPAMSGFHRGTTMQNILGLSEASSATQERHVPGFFQVKLIDWEDKEAQG